MTTSTLAVIGYVFLGLLACAGLFLALVAGSAAADSRRRHKTAPGRVIGYPKVDASQAVETFGAAAKTTEAIALRQRAARPQSVVVARKLRVIRAISEGPPLALFVGDEHGSAVVEFETPEQALGVAVALEAEARDLLGLPAGQPLPPGEGAPGWAPLRSVPTQGPDG